MPPARDRGELAEQLALVLTDHGMQRMTARVMATFLFTERPTLTQGDLAEELDASAGSVSGAIRMLTSVGLVERVPAGTSRRDHHRLRADAWTTLFSQQNQVVEAMRTLADEGIQATAPTSHARHRLQRMRDFYDFLLSRLPGLVEEWERQHPDPGPPPS